MGGETRRAASRDRAFRGRVSPQRSAIADAVDAMDSAFSAEQLAAAVRATGTDVGTATVYRAVAAMEDSGWIEAIGARDGAALYARCRREGHHHHLVCESCGRVAETDCDLGDALDRASAASGFTVTRHEFSLYGVCATCAQRGTGR